MNQCLMQPENTEMYSTNTIHIKVHVLNKFVDYYMTSKCCMVHHKACIKMAILGALEKTCMVKKPSPHYSGPWGQPSWTFLPADP